MFECIKKVLAPFGFGYKISVINKQGRHIIDLPTRLLIRHAVSAALDYECIPHDKFQPEVSVSIVNDRQIHMMNIKYRGIDRSTDVLSFPLLSDGIPTPDDIDIRTGRIPLGDIVISIDHAYRQAIEYGHSVRREIAFLCVHSVLHLLGYDHVTSKDDERIMFGRQEAILESMGITR